MAWSELLAWSVVIISWVVILVPDIQLGSEVQMTPSPLGRFVRHRREELKLTMRQIAEAIDVPYIALDDQERGMGELPTNRLPALAEILNVPLAKLRELDER